MRGYMLFSITGLLLAGTACDYTGDWLFASEVEGVPGIIHLGELTPATVTNTGSVADAILFGEVGPTGTADVGGVTFTFQGTGGNVCLWVDPELLYWNQSVATQRPNTKFGYPDNVTDDGDLDLSAGLAAYYNGSPGEAVGTFEVRYTDSLGNPITVALNECVISSLTASTLGHSGRGAPEFCTLYNTQPGVDYLVLMETWSLPLDDSRLSYGLLVTNGDCDELITARFGGQPSADDPFDECLIMGEAIPGGTPGFPGPWTGDAPPESRPGSKDLETLYCTSGDLSAFCQEEAAANSCRDAGTRCFCGDPTDTPRGGSF